MIYGCIAEKLGHSFSKDIHNRLFDYSYELCEVAADKLDTFMKEKAFKAINVTIPYKEKVIPYLDEISDIAKKIGSVNTIINNNGYLRGYNTDFFGLTALIERNGITIENRKVLILGSGGTSKTAYAVAESMNCSEVYRVSRDGKEDCITYDLAVKKHNDADVIINTTPVGMFPKIGITPVDLDDYPNVSAVVDAVYNPLRSKLVIDARKKGIVAVGGLYMLVAQAAFAAELFTDTKLSVFEIDRVYAEIVNLKQNVVLTGMPGAGKTTIGKLLAEKLGSAFVDTDAEIVKRENKTIAEIFEEVGESGFRKIETEVIFSLAHLQNTVIATGGGAILNGENIDILRENGKIYFLDRDIDKIVATSDRPLSSDREALEKRYKERYEYYCRRCDKHVKIGDDAEENANEIKRDFLNENIGDKRP